MSGSGARVLVIDDDADIDPNQIQQVFVNLINNAAQTVRRTAGSYAQLVAAESALVSAADAGSLWDLRCLVRER